MSWSLFLIALLVVSVVQSSVLAVMQASVFDVPLINLYLGLTLVVGLVARRDDARLAGLTTGLLADLAGVGAFGIQAFALGLTAWLLTMWRDALRTHLWFARVILCFLAALPGELFLSLHTHFWQLPVDTPVSFWERLLSGVIVSAVAAVLAATVTEFPQFRRFRGMSRRYAGRL
jgi:rod shape-determining protein MreD